MASIHVRFSEVSPLQKHKSRGVGLQEGRRSECRLKYRVSSQIKQAPRSSGRRSFL